MKLTTLALTLALAQAPQPPPVFRAGTDLVEVDVITRDKAGVFVSDLAIDDFELREDGKPLPVQQVYLRLAGPAGWGSTLRPGGTPAPAAARAPSPPDAGAPTIFVVVFDDAHLTPAGFKRTQAAALSLFEKQLRDGDVGGVVSNGRMANGRLTSDRAELIKAVKDAKPNGKTLSTRMDEQQWPRLTEIEALQVVVNDNKEMYDLVTRRACDEQKPICDGPAGDDPVRGMIRGKGVQLSTNAHAEAVRTLAMLGSVLTGLGRLGGPKNVLLMSEGFLSEETWPEVQESVSLAARSSTRIYTLDARGLGGRGLASVDSVAPVEGLSRMFEQMDPAGDAVNSLAVDTGGFVVRNVNQFDQAIARVADDAGNYYVLGYLPPSPADGKYHKISVRVKRAGVSVRSRRGYTASPRPAPASTTASTVRLKPDTTLTPTETPAETPVVSGFSRTSSEPSPASELPAAPIAPAAASVVAVPPDGSVAGRIRVRPDAAKHIDMLLPDPSADRAAAAGWEAYQRGDVATARASLSVAAASPRAEAWVNYALGLSEYALGAWANAVAAWEKVRAAAPAFEPVYFDLVDGYLQLKEHDKAIRLLREGAANWPTDPDVYNALGVVQTVKGALPDAIAAFHSAIAAAPGDAVSHFNLGRALELRYFRTRRYVRQTKRWIADEKDRAGAIEEYERYLSIGGPYADAAREGVTRLKWAASPQ